MKLRIYFQLPLLLFFHPLLLPQGISYGQNCPPSGFPEYTIECFDGFDYFCCHQDFTVCCFDDVFNYWCCPAGTSCGDYYNADQQCLKDSSPSTTTIPEGGTTTTVPGSDTTTTIPGGSSSAGQYIAAININGNGENDSPESSGTLPGTSFFESTPMLYRQDGKPLIRWHDQPFPRPDLSSIRQTKEVLKKRAETLHSEDVTVYDVGDTGFFWVKDNNDSAWRQVSATVQKSGTHANIFVDNTISISNENLEEYATEFETMYTVVRDNIGVFTDRNGDNKVAVLLYAMNDDGSVATGYMGGYFWSKDYLNDSTTSVQGIRSNEMDIIYIRGNEPQGWSTETDYDFYNYNLTTLVHEYQHLVHFCIKVWTQGNSGDFSDVWIDEMMAMASETMYFKYKLQNDTAYSHPSMQGQGYLADRIEYYNIDPRDSIKNGHGLSFWDNQGDVFANYTLSYLFGQYLAIQSSTGQDIFKAILDYMIANGVHDYQGVVGAASQRISGIGSWEDLLKSFYFANLANEASGRYGYNSNFTVSAQGPTADSVNIHNSGAVYRKVDGAWSAPADAGPSIRFHETSASVTPGTTTVPSGGGGDTTTTVSGGACGIARLLGHKSAKTALIRNFRDTVLRKTGYGRELIDLYYLHTAEVVSIVTNKPKVRALAGKTLVDLLPALDYAVKKNHLKLTSFEISRINKLCEALKQHAGPDLTYAIETLQNDLLTGTLLNDLTIE